MVIVVVDVVLVKDMRSKLIVGAPKGILFTCTERRVKDVACLCWIMTRKS